MKKYLEAKRPSRVRNFFKTPARPSSPTPPTDVFGKVPDFIASYQNTLNTALQIHDWSDVKLLAETLQRCWRENRQDSLFRRMASKIVNKIISWSTGVKLKDYGCMLRAYRREIVQQIGKCSEISSFIPALANTFARSIAEIEVPHRDRAQGRSKYSLGRLIRLNFDLMTGFSLFPIQAISAFGLVTALVGVGFSVFLFIRRLIIGPEAEGLFTLFAILFAFIGVQIMALGIIGEYVGRIYNEVRKRPRFVIRNVYSKAEHPPLARTTA